MSVATAIDRLSEAANRTASDEDDAEMLSLNGDNNNDVRDITNKAVRQTIEENQDLKRQNILLEQQLDEKERRIKVLERLLLSEGKSFRNILDGERSSVNTASQVSYLLTLYNHIYKEGSCLVVATNVFNVTLSLLINILVSISLAAVAWLNTK